MIRASFEVDGEVLILTDGNERPDLPVALRYEPPAPVFSDNVTPYDIVSDSTPMRVLLRGEDIGRAVAVRINGEHVYSDSDAPVDFIVHSTTIDFVMELALLEVTIPTRF
jgi:hypothetical protein